MAKEGFISKFVLYAGMRSADEHIFYVLDSLDQNNGAQISINVDIMRFVKPLFTRLAVGYVYPADISADRHIMYDKKATPVGYWSNKDDIAAWKLRQAPYIKLAESKRKWASASVEDTLKPLIRIYRSANYEEKRFILAEILRVVTREDKNIF